MKTIKLTAQNGKESIIVVDNIFEIKGKGENKGSFITSIGGDTANVKESPKEINDMIKKL